MSTHTPAPASTHTPAPASTPPSPAVYTLLSERLRALVAAIDGAEAAIIGMKQSSASAADVLSNIANCLAATERVHAAMCVPVDPTLGAASQTATQTVAEAKAAVHPVDASAASTMVVTSAPMAPVPAPAAPAPAPAPAAPAALAPAPAPAAPAPALTQPTMPALPTVTTVSYGVIPFARVGDEWYVGLIEVRKPSGHIVYGFTKGKPEDGETMLMTMERELREESNCAPIYWVHHDRFHTGIPNVYKFRANDTRTNVYTEFNKTVFYQPVVVRQVEPFMPTRTTHEDIVGFRFHSVEAALELLTVPSLRELLIECHELMPHTSHY